MENKKDKSSSCDYNTWVYIWKMTGQSVGHAAIQVGGCSPKINPNDTSSDYASIHPHVIPSVGPTAILPLPAELAQTLTEDMGLEGGTKHNIIDELDGIVMPVFKDKSTSYKAPSDIFKINTLDTKAMRKMIQKTREETQLAETTYQLFPNVNTLKFFKEIPQHITYNPIDSANPPIASETNNSYGKHKYNCATLVGKILNEGGLPIKHSNTPWGQTPDNLAEQLKKGF